MARSESTVLNLVGKVYEAAMDEGKWQPFLGAFANAVGGCSAMLHSVDLLTHKSGFFASAGFDPAWKLACCDHFVKQVYPTLHEHEASNVRTDGQVLSTEDQGRTRFYNNNYLIPRNRPHTMGVLLANEDSRTLFAAQRVERAGAFGKEEARLMDALAPHLTRAVQVHCRLRSATVEREWALGTLNRLRVGVIVTDCSGKPLFINRAAELMMESDRGVCVHQGRLVLDNASETALLHGLIARAARTLSETATGSDMRIALPKKSGVLHCLVAPVSAELSVRLDISRESGCVALFLSKPGSLRLPPKRLATLYGLSPAESRLVAELAAVNSLEQAAKDLGIAMGTARTQLAAAFAKTCTSTQAELLMLLATGTLAQCHTGTDVGGGE